jgi:TRAP-type C4-dicarboxylate transport system substrate-binding protein
VKRIIIITFTVLLLAAIVLGGCAAPAPTPTPTPAPTPTPTPTPAPVQPIIIKAGHDQPPFSPMAQSLEKWGNEVSKRSGGQVVFEFYPSATLFAPAATLDSITSGVADIGMPAFTNFNKRLPISNIVAVPGLGFPYTPEGMVAASAAFKSLMDKYPALAAEYKDFKYLWEYHGESYSLYVKGPEARTPADLKGMKIGASGLRLQTVEALGGVPVNIVPPEAYQNLQTGVIGAQLMSWNMAKDFKIWEVTKYAVIYDFGQVGFPVIMNLNTWNKLSPEIHKIMSDVREEELIAFQKGSIAASEEAKQMAIDNGMTMIIPTEAETEQWDAACKSVLDAWIAGAKAAGVENPEDILNDWKKAIADFKAKS